MKKIPTAKKYLQGSETYDKDYPTISLYDAEQRMIEFAKLHVENFTKSNLNLEEYLKLHVK
jgi:hypothetical protein